MPIVEFMLHPTTDGSYIGRDVWLAMPPFIVGGEWAWESPLNSTRLGYVLSKEARPYYVPDTLKTLDKEACIQRALKIQAENSQYTKTEKKPDATDAEIKRGEDMVSVLLNENEIREMIGNWYDEVMQRMGEV